MILVTATSPFMEIRRTFKSPSRVPAYLRKLRKLHEKYLESVGIEQLQRPSWGEMSWVNRRRNERVAEHRGKVALYKLTINIQTN